MHLTVKKDMIIITSITNICSDLAKGGYEWIRNQEPIWTDVEDIVFLLFSTRTTNDRTAVYANLNLGHMAQ